MLDSHDSHDSRIVLVKSWLLDSHDSHVSSMCENNGL
jgi:hypothetical protein